MLLSRLCSFLAGPMHSLSRGRTDEASHLTEGERCGVA
jgi:hypothetical protein